MTQYLKHYYVSAKTPSIVLSETNDIEGGKMHPNVIGLDVQMQLQTENGIDYCLSVAPDDSDASAAGIQSLTEAEWKSEWVTVFQLTKSAMVRDVYLQYKTLFEQLPDEYYHPYEMLYSNYIKRVEASKVDANMTEEQAAAVGYKAVPKLLKDKAVNPLEAVFETADPAFT